MVVKKGAWTPEEDITLVSYIQEHGPGNWRAVPSNTGLKRCSKSCRLRWSNYLRPGIKRGGFTLDEEKMIIHLQALLGNRWSAMASYLHQRTDNDIKNYWNSHLKKKLSRMQQGHGEIKESENGNSSSLKPISKGQWERRLQTDIQTAKQALCDALSLDDSPSSVSKRLFPKVTQPIQTSTYAASADNIARLLKNWTKESEKKASNQRPGSTFNNDPCSVWLTSSPSEGQMSNLTFIGSGFNSCSDVSQEGQAANLTPETGISFRDDRDESKINSEMSRMPFSLLEKWLLDDAAAQGQDGNFMDMALGESADFF